MHRLVGLEAQPVTSRAHRTLGSVATGPPRTDPASSRPLAAVSPCRGLYLPGAAPQARNRTLKEAGSKAPGFELWAGCAILVTGFALG